MKASFFAHLFSHKTYLFILLFLGIAILKPFTGFLLFLSQGDHGLILYAVQAVLKGAVPYQDFSWNYGPLMIYYYAPFMKVFGATIQSVLLGKALLILLAGLLFYGNLSVWVPRWFSALGTVWFWIFFKDFPYTFNHTGGIPVLLLISFCTLQYIKFSNSRMLYASLLGIVLLSLIKLNLGFAALLAFLLIIFIDSLIQKKHPVFFYFLSILIVPTLVVFIYWIFVRHLPFYYIRQCLPYFGTHFQITGLGDAYQQNILLNLLVNGYLLSKNIFSSWENMAFALLINLSAFKGLHIWKNAEPADKRKIFVSFLVPVFFYVLCLHEFVMMGKFYQAYWSEPFKVLLMFLVMGFALNHAKWTVQAVIFLLICGLAFLKIPTDSVLFNQYQSPASRFKIAETDIKISNDPAWIQTVTATTHYLHDHLKDNELFWAIPYDPLYYFLADKASPTPELSYVNLVFPTEQEIEIIRNLEKKKVGWIVLSNRDKEPGIIPISDKYCPLLAKYMADHFTVVAQFGEWNAEPLWWSHHGTKILKRK